MRSSHLVAIFCICLPLCAQAPQSDDQTLATLLGEVRELRLAIERSTLLGTKTQIAIQLLQAQEARTEKVAKNLDEVRKQASRFDEERASRAGQLRIAEARLSDSATTPNERVDLERMVRAIKGERGEPSPEETQIRAREAEVQGQLQAEQGRLMQLQNQISDMERALDDAIRQMTQQSRPESTH